MIGKMKMGKINVKSLMRIFEEANQNFLEKNQLLFEAEVSAICMASPSVSPV